MCLDHASGVLGRCPGQQSHMDVPSLQSSKQQTAWLTPAANIIRGLGGFVQTAGVGEGQFFSVLPLGPPSLVGKPASHPQTSVGPGALLARGLALGPGI